MWKNTMRKKCSFSKRKYMKDIKKRGLWAANINLLKKKKKKKTRRIKKLLKNKVKL